MHITQCLLDWYDKNKRILPWREENRDPYKIWLSEIYSNRQLQQQSKNVTLFSLQPFLILTP